jgi:exosortase J
MATQAAISECQQEALPGGRDNVSRRRLRGVIFSVAVVLGLLALMPALHSACRLWMTDPLRSIGMFMPIVSVALIVREWRRLGWEMRPTWWGLVPLLLAAVILAVRQTRWVYLHVRGGSSIDLLPDGLVIALYVAAFLLMFGGLRVCRGALFPLVLLLLVNPVPNVIGLLDLPLQHLSADTARHFAALIGEHPDGTQLRLMFTPDFGMFIAPGCDGIRGAVALGYLGLFASYWRGLSVSLRLLSMLSGVVLGYLFNFVRLCLLVIYYKIGESFPSIQPHGTMVDYAIGAVLFLVVSLCFATVFFRGPARGEFAAHELDATDDHASGSRWVVAVFLLVSAAIAATNLKALAAEARAAGILTRNQPSVAQFPDRIGRYHLVASWDDYLAPGFKAYRWGRYSDGQADDDVLLGLWVAGSYHNAIGSHLIRGEKVDLGSDIAHTSGTGVTTVYNTFSYENGLGRVFAASSVCDQCFGAPNFQRYYGPFRVTLGRRTDYFGSPFIGAMLVKHESIAQGPDNSLQVREFITHLDERQFIDVHSR